MRPVLVVVSFEFVSGDELVQRGEALVTPGNYCHFRCLPVAYTRGRRLVSIGSNS